MQQVGVARHSFARPLLTENGRAGIPVPLDMTAGQDSKAQGAEHSGSIVGDWRGLLSPGLKALSCREPAPHCFHQSIVGGLCSRREVGPIGLIAFIMEPPLTLNARLKRNDGGTHALRSRTNDQPLAG